MLKYVMLTLFALIAACSVRPETPREKLLAAEISYQGALKEVIVLAEAGVIKGQAARQVKSAIAVVDSAMETWRANPDNPNYMQGAINALQPLLDLVNQLRARRTTGWSVMPPFLPPDAAPA